MLPQVAVFQKTRRSLAHLAGRLAAIFTLLGNDRRAQTLSQVKSKLASERFKILVIGEISRGKSSLINALLGDAVVPVNTIPCTAVIQEIRWGRTRRAALHFRQPLPSPLPAATPPDVMVHLSLAEEGQVPPLEVPVDHLEEYVGVLGDEGRREMPYSKVEIFWPLALCRHAIELVDTPGLNRDSLRNHITREQIPESDAVLFVLSCSLLGAATEISFIDRDLRELGFERLFFVCNRFDEIRQSERQRLMSFGRKKLAGYTELGEAGVWFVSALQALEGKLHGDLARLGESGLPSFERALLEFLHRDRGRIKLLQPTLKLLHAIHELRNEVLPKQFEAMLEDLAVLEDEVETARQELEKAEDANSQTLVELENRRQELCAEVRTLAAGFLHDMAGRISEWIDRFKLEKGLRRLPLKHTKEVEALAREVCANVGVRLEAELAAWKESCLMPLVDSRLGRMMGDVSLRVDHTSIRVDLLRSAVTQVVVALHAREPSVSERIAAALGGSLVAFAYWAGHGFKWLGWDSLAEIAFYAIVYRLVLSMLGAGLVGTWFRAGALTKAAKREIANALAAQAHAGADAAAQELADAVYEKTEKYVQRTREGLDHEISGLREEMGTVKQAGEERVRARKELLLKLDGELREIDSIFTPLVEVALAERGAPRRSTPHGVAEATTGPAGNIRILFLAADPFSNHQNRLRLDRELREIREQISLARLKDSLELRPEMAVRPKDVTRALQEYEPQIVHFSGHGDKDGKFFVEDDAGTAHAITAQALAKLFEHCANKVQCVILNACYSDLEAAMVSKMIRYVVGMRSAVKDQAAISFSVGFYQALGAGRAIDECFAVGCVLVGMDKDTHDSDIPVLWKDGKAV